MEDDDVDNDDDDGGSLEYDQAVAVFWNMIRIQTSSEQRRFKMHI